MKLYSQNISKVRFGQMSRSITTFGVERYVVESAFHFVTLAAWKEQRYFKILANTWCLLIA